MVATALLVHTQENTVAHRTLIGTVIMWLLDRMSPVIQLIYLNFGGGGGVGCTQATLEAPPREVV